MKIEIKTIRELIKHLGGQTVVAKKVGITSQAVNHWCLTGRIMTKYWLKVIEVGNEKGIEITSDDLMEMILREYRNRGHI